MFRTAARLQTGGWLADPFDLVCGAPFAASSGAGDPELGYDPDADFVANSSRSFQQWEREVQAMISIVRQQNWTDGEPVLPSWDPVRRAIESLPKPVCEYPPPRTTSPPHPT